MRWRRLVLATSLSPTFLLIVRMCSSTPLGGEVPKRAEGRLFFYIINTMNTPHRISKVLPTA